MWLVMLCRSCHSRGVSAAPTRKHRPCSLSWPLPPGLWTQPKQWCRQDCTRAGSEIQLLYFNASWIQNNRNGPDLWKWDLIWNVIRLIESFLIFAFLLHRRWHQELLQKDWLQVARPIHGKDAEIKATPVHLDVVLSLARNRFQMSWLLSREAEQSKWTYSVPWHEASPSSCSCRDWNLFSAVARWLLSRREPLAPGDPCHPLLRVLNKPLQFSRLKSCIQFLNSACGLQVTYFDSDTVTKAN